MTSLVLTVHDRNLEKRGNFVGAKITSFEYLGLFRVIYSAKRTNGCLHHQIGHDNAATTSLRREAEGGEDS